MYGMKKNISKYCIYIIILSWAVLCFMFFQYYYQYHFFYKEQNQIFLISWSYISSYLSKPAWVACLIGDFLTQFYYYLYAGAVILTLSLLLMGRMICCSLKQVGFRTWISVLITVIAMTFEAICHFSEDFRLSSTFAVIGGVSFFTVAKFLSEKKSKMYWIVNNDIIIMISVFLTYWMFGYGSVLYAVLVAINGFKCSTLKLAILRIVYVILLFICILFFAQDKYLLSVKDVLVYPGIGKLEKPELELEKYLEIDNEYYFKHYNKVVALAGKAKNNSPEISVYYYLALSQKGILADFVSFGDVPTLGTLYRVGPETPIAMLRIMNELYYLLGDMTFAERAAMIAGVSSPDKRNVRMIKRLAEVNLVNNDIPAAMKYLRILDKTLVYHKWAVEHTPGTQKTEVKTEIMNKRLFINKTDTIRKDDNCYTILIELLESNPKNKIALDYLLCSDLVAHDIGLFKSDYDRYYHLQKRDHKEILYMQALNFYNTNKPEIK